MSIEVEHTGPGELGIGGSLGTSGSKRAQSARVVGTGEDYRCKACAWLTEADATAASLAERGPEGASVKARASTGSPGQGTRLHLPARQQALGWCLQWRGVVAPLDRSAAEQPPSAPLTASR